MGKGSISGDRPPISPPATEVQRGDVPRTGLLSRVKVKLGLASPSRAQAAVSDATTSDKSMTDHTVKVGPPSEPRVQSLGNVDAVSASPKHPSATLQDLAKDLSTAVLKAKQGDLISSTADITSKLAKILDDRTSPSAAELADLEPKVFLAKLTDAAVAATPKADQEIVRTRLNFLRNNGELQGVYDAAKRMNEPKQRLIAQRTNFEPKIVTQQTSIEDLPASVKNDPAFQTMMKDFAEVLGSRGSDVDKQKALTEKIGPQLNALLSHKDVPYGTKLALTLGDGKVFMKSIGDRIVQDTPLLSRLAVKNTLERFTKDGTLTKVYDRATVNLGDRADASTIIMENGDRAEVATITVNGETYYRVPEEEGGKLGSGNFGEVFLYKKDVDDPDELGLVVKSAKADDPDDHEKLIDAPAREGRMIVNAMGSGASADYVVPLKAAIRTDDGKLLLVLGMAKHGSADNALRKIDAAESEERIDHKTAAAFKLTPILDLAKAIERLQLAKGESHFDIAMRNVLINDKGVAQLSDFGMAEQLGVDGKKPTEGRPIKGAKAPAKPDGTMLPLRWTAPEVLLGKPATAASDTWMFGMALWEAVYGQNPIHTEYASMDAARKALKFDPPADLPPISAEKWPNGLAADLGKLLSKCLQTDPAKRISMDDVLRHPALNAPGVGTAETRGELVKLLAKPEAAPPVNTPPKDDAEAHAYNIYANSPATNKQN